LTRVMRPRSSSRGRGRNQYKCPSYSYSYRNSYSIFCNLLGRTGTRLSLPSQYWVPRIRLMFRAEDPRLFAERVAEAFVTRRLTEALLRYHLYVDCMPMDGIGELDQASLKRMIDWAKGAPQLAKDRE